MRIAIAQTPGAHSAAWRATLSLLDTLLDDAHRANADLVVFPECAWPAYALTSRAAYAAARAAGLPAPADFLTHLAGRARALGLYICAGYVEERGAALYNAASLIAPQGDILLTHRKCFLWDFDHDYFTPGDTLAVCATPLGRIGVMICADARLPEIPATLVARGAQLLVQPTAWVNAGTSAQPWNPQPDFLIPSRAAELGVTIAAASKWGTEGNTEFVGSSLICDTDGLRRAACPARATTLAVADIDLSPPPAPAVTPPERALLLASPTDSPPTDPALALQLVLWPPSPPTSTPLAACSSPTNPTWPSHLVTVDLCLPTHTLDTPTAGAPNHLALAGPCDAMLACGGVRIAALPAAELARFAPARCATLQGAHLIAAFGDDVRAAHVRTRACENRVYVLWLTRAAAHLFDPSGLELVRTPWPPERPVPLAGPLPLASAACKQVCPDTDVICGRCVDQYEF